MNARSLARLLVIVALACAGVFLIGAAAHAQDGATVQNGNKSKDSTARSAPATSGNTSTSQSGPSARNGGDSAMVGDTDTKVDQNSGAESGPASAGSQFSNPGPGSTEQNNNTSVGATARSGPVTSFNTANTHNGPFANGGDATQVGDGTLDVTQDAFGRSGAARSGSQFTNSDADAVTQNINECGNAVTDCGTATSGRVRTANTLGTAARPAGTGPVAIAKGKGSDATARQVGDDDAVLKQRAVGVSGDATVGSQDTSGGGTVQNKNTAKGDKATSGPVTADNAAVANVGPFAFAKPGSTATSTQRGDSSGDLDQVARASSGDAVSGSQTTDPNGDQNGHLTVQNRSASEDDTAVTGAADAGSAVTSFAGPTSRASKGGDADARLRGDTSFDIVTNANAASGDAWAGTQHTNAEGGATVQNRNSSRLGVARSGDACAAPTCHNPRLSGGNTVVTVSGPAATSNGQSADATQRGDDSVGIDLRTRARSGDALVGSQDVKASDSSTTQNRNDSLRDTAITGDAVSGNAVTGAAGPVAGGLVKGAPFDTDARQRGDDSLDITGNARATSGDAITGSQVSDASGDAVLQNRNDSARNVSRSGRALSGNAATTFAGPFAGLKHKHFGGAVTGSSGASAAQRGDDSVKLDMDARATSGDATSGSQLSKVDSSTVENRNFARRSSAFSATACASPTCTGKIKDANGNTAFVPGGNQAFVFAGPVAGGNGSSDATLRGDADASLRQQVRADTGDATASSQVDTVAGDSTVQNRNDSRDAFAGCRGCSAVAGNRSDAFVGPLALASAGNAASATQRGDSTLDAGKSQTAHASVGESTAGSQFTDARGGATAQDRNQARGAVARAGSATAYNALGSDPFHPSNLQRLTVVGAAALATTADANATLRGDAKLKVDQTVSSGSGDATSGSQVIGLNGGTSQVRNHSTNDSAVSGAAFGFNSGGGVIGPRAKDADAVQKGDDSGSFDSSSSAFSGDVAAGSQLIGDAGVTSFDFGDAVTASPFGVPSGAEKGQTSGLQGSVGGFSWSSGSFVGEGLGAAA